MPYGSEECEVCGKEFPSREAAVLPSGQVACTECMHSYYNSRDVTRPGRESGSDTEEVTPKSHLYGESRVRVIVELPPGESLPHGFESNVTVQPTHHNENEIAIYGEEDDVLDALVNKLGLTPQEAQDLIDGESEESLSNIRDDYPQMGVPDDQNEGFLFDKFMDNIVLEESARKKTDIDKREPLRERAMRHQDRPMNRTRFGRTK